MLLKIQENELFDGYLGRLAKINDQGDRRGEFAGFTSDIPERLGTPKFLDALEKHSALPKGTLIDRHTLVAPLLGSDLASKIDPLGAGSAFRRICGYAKDGLWFCRVCVVNDVKTRSFSYWRRDHQLPGIYSCPIHRSSLIPVRIGRIHPSRFSPGDTRVEAILSNTASDHAKNPFIRRASNFILRKLDQSEDQRFEKSAMKDYLPAVYQAAGERKRGNDPDLLIHWSLADAFPTGWIIWQKNAGTLSLECKHLSLTTCLRNESKPLPLLFWAMLDAVYGDRRSDDFRASNKPIIHTSISHAGASRASTRISALARSAAPFNP